MINTKMYVFEIDVEKQKTRQVSTKYEEDKYVGIEESILNNGFFKYDADNVSNNSGKVSLEEKDLQEMQSNISNKNFHRENKEKYIISKEKISELKNSETGDLLREGTVFAIVLEKTVEEQKQLELILNTIEDFL